MTAHKSYLVIVFISLPVSFLPFLLYCDVLYLERQPEKKSAQIRKTHTKNQFSIKTNKTKTRKETTKESYINSNRDVQQQ